MKIVVDMNLSPLWVEMLVRQGHDAYHWSSIGDPRAPDSVIMSYARDHGCIVFTHDLDFSTLLALTHDNGPSIIQVRAQNIMPRQIGVLVVAAINKFETQLLKGAILTIDTISSRIRLLPL